jgi:AcrR family transcriptional regulator
MQATPPRPRGRPREFDREKALLAALRVFRERGYEGTSLAELQEAMGGISPPSVYAAFGSKEELFKETVSMYVKSTGQAGRLALEGASTTRDAIERFLRASVDAITKAGEPRGCMLVLCALNCTAKDAAGAAASEHVHALRVEAQRGILARIKRGVREGDLPRETHAESLATFVTTVAHGLSIQARDGVSRAALNRAVDHAMLAWDASVG